MREIKFRAWDISSQKMIEVHKLSMKNMTSVTNMYYKNNEDILNIFLMQYTGLKDKNGVEIYEGDIIEFKNEHMNKADKYFIKYDTARLCFCLNDTDYVEENVYGSTIPDTLDNGIVEEEKLEVIGNIYENPELLK